MRTLTLLTLLMVAGVLHAQCPQHGRLLTPTIRALLMLERPAAVSVELWEKIIENPNNQQDLQIKIYEGDSFDPCELPPAGWYVLLPGRRPLEKVPPIVPAVVAGP